MEVDHIEPALAEWRVLLGAEHVVADPAGLSRYTRNVSGLQRRVPAVLRPASTADVQGLVQIANRFRVPLYPISAGRNWGLGSALPVGDDQVIVDLSRLNRIIEVNVDFHYAVVEAGVTQGQLFDYLQERRLPLRLNVTGAGRKTSLIGNALERGIGYFSSRADALYAMEVVLGDGRIIRTGSAHIEHCAMARLYRHGIGPGLDGLFSQSNFGIVTQAALDLIPASGRHVAVVAKIDDDSKLPAFIDALAGLRRREIIRTVVHVGNRARTEITLGPMVLDYLKNDSSEPDDVLRERAREYIRREGFGPWSAVWGALGTPAELAGHQEEVRAALRGLAELVILDDARLARAKTVLSLFRFVPAARRKRALLGAIEPLFGMSKGVPTDEPLKSIFWPVGESLPPEGRDPDQGHSGMLYALPFVPLRGPLARAVVRCAEEIFSAHGFTPYMTLNLVDSRCLECVVNLAFDQRNHEQSAQAHAAIRTFQEECQRQGFLLYRVGVQSMESILDPGDPYWQTVRDLKQALDPNHIIAPGRYNLV
jgi:4-cresol dehydrogenase (hydroxylating)